MHSLVARQFELINPIGGSTCVGEFNRRRPLPGSGYPQRGAPNRPDERVEGVIECALVVRLAHRLEQARW